MTTPSGSNDGIIKGNHNPTDIMDKLNSGAEKLGLHLSQRQLEQFSIYYHELVDWNQRLNLTTITDYEEVQIKHLLDSLTVILALKQPAGSSSIIDVGSGAGLPGIPLKITFPNIKLVLLESVAKKAAFLNHVKQKLGLDNVAVVTGRAEEVAHLSEYRERFDIVLSRAVAPLPVLIELTLPFSTVGGSVIAQKKGEIEQEIIQATGVIRIMGGNLREVKNVDLTEFTDQRMLIVIDKISLTPPRYPRRPGIPAKRPLLDKQS